MTRKRYTPKDMTQKLREAEVVSSQGNPVSAVNALLNIGASGVVRLNFVTLPAAR